MYATQQLDSAAPLTRVLLNAGAEVRVRRASAFCALLRGVVHRRRLEDCDTTLALICRQMARKPAEMQRHVLGAMVSQGQHIRLLGPVFLELKSRIRRYWSQPAELRHLCCESVRQQPAAGWGNRGRGFPTGCAPCRTALYHSGGHLLSRGSAVRRAAADRDVT